MTPIIKDNETFEVSVYQVVDKKGKESFSLTNDGTAAAELKITFKRPAWGDIKEIMSKSVAMIEGKAQIDPYRLMDTRLKVLIRSWNLTGEDGKPIPSTPENTDRLSPPLADVINQALMQSGYLD
jgi:hypothetical protein